MIWAINDIRNTRYVYKKSLKAIELQENNLFTDIHLIGNTFVLTKEERQEMEELSKVSLEKGIRFCF